MLTITLFLPERRRARYLLSLLAALDANPSPYVQVHEDVLKAGERSAPQAIAFVDLCVVEHKLPVKILVVHHLLQRDKHQKILCYATTG